jgi:nitrate reductase delta subunit
VATFDLQKRCSLHLSYYLHGDRRQRGLALLHLKRMYAAAGLLLEGGELPDYLPAMLEFAAFAPPGYGEMVLRQFRPAIELLRVSLRELGSPYAHLLDALCAGLPRLSVLEAAQVTRLIAEGPPSEQVGLEPFAPPEVMPRGAQR